MNYSGFFIDKPVGNNAFSFNERKNKKLYVPELLEISNFDEIKLQDDKEKIAFEDFDFDDKLSTNYGLKNFYKIKWNNKNIYLFDNHNHALYFWYLAKSEKIIGNNNTLIHIDEHADTRDPGEYLKDEEYDDLEKVFNYTNFSKVNVGNYIVPAEKSGLIKETIQIRNTQNLEDYLEKYMNTPILNSFPLQEKEATIFPSQERGGIILNLDLDFFQPDLDFIDYELKKKVVLDAAEKASVITVCTSPFFINQELALKVFKDIFGK